MALSIKIECFGVVHEILVAATGSGDAFDVELVDHEDREHDDMLAFMTGQRCECYHVEEILGLGLQEVFENRDFGKLFVAALKDQGIKALGMDREDFATYTMNFVEWLLQMGETWGGEFLEEIRKGLPWVKDTTFFKRVLHGLVRLAYQLDDLALFRELDEMTEEQLITVSATNIEGEENGTFAGHVQGETKIDFLVGGEAIDSWTFVWKGWFTDYFPFRWHTDIEHTEEPDWYRLDCFLRGSPITRKYLPDDYKPSAPELPHQKNDGDWAVILWFGNVRTPKRFATEEDACEVFNAMRDASFFRGETLGLNAEVVHKEPDSNRADDEDYAFDPEDPSTWEPIVSDEV